MHCRRYPAGAQGRLAREAGVITVLGRVEMGKQAENALWSQAAQGVRRQELVPGDLGLLSKLFLQVTSLVKRCASFRHLGRVVHSPPEKMLSVPSGRQYNTTVLISRLELECNLSCQLNMCSAPLLPLGWGGCIDMRAHSTAF